MRKDIKLKTFKKIEEFLKNLKEPMYKCDIARELKVDYNSLTYAIGLMSKRLLKNVKENSK